MSGADSSSPRPAPHRALILSGSIGKGHDTVAEACADALATVGCSTEVVDCMGLLGGMGSRAGDAVFRSLMAVPGAYDALHFTSMRPGGRVARYMDYAATHKLLKPMRDLLARDPADLLLSVFATGAGVADLVLAPDDPVSSVVYCTDACPHRMWVHDRTDLFLVTAPMSGAFVRYHRPDADVAVVPPAARNEFYEPPTRADARHALGIVASGPVVLVIAGGWGFGPLDRLAHGLAHDGVTVLAVAGSNERLRGRLQRAAVEADRGGVAGRIVVFGYTHRVHELMAAADVVVTTPGDTCTEARLIGRPMVLLDTIPGHGRENLQLELSRGGAAAVSPDPRIVGAAVARALAGGLEPAPGPPLVKADWQRQFLASLAPVGVTLPLPPHG